MLTQTNPERKIKTLDELEALLSLKKREGLRVVHCHGVFDLLHIGHIRHFREAKKFGDVLIVTVTPDVHVNKGPHRPVFDQHLRAEAIASLDSVDYVAINLWPSAIETIGRLRPDVYAKGPDYKESWKDLTGKILEEKAAIESLGGQMVFTEDIAFSSSALINRFLPPLPESASSWLRDFSSRYAASGILSLLDRMASVKVLVVGESIIDEYQYCEAIGKSSKEPTLAVKSLSREKFLGGSLMVAQHAAGFCGATGLVTLLGDDDERAFVAEHLDSTIRAEILERKGSPTIVKRRFIESYFFSKLFEVYEINDSALDPADDRKLCEALEKHLPAYDAVIVADYGHSMLTREAIDILCERSRFLALNVQSNAGNLGYHAVSSYRRADYLCMTEGELRLEARDRRGDLKKMVQALSEKMRCGRLMITRGSHGNLCFGASEGFFETPAFTTRVVDRVGAGDACLAVTAPCAALGASMEAIGFIANAVGAQAVARVGNRAPVERIALYKQIESLLK